MKRLLVTLPPSVHDKDVLLKLENLKQLDVIVAGDPTVVMRAETVAPAPQALTKETATGRRVRLVGLTEDASLNDRCGMCIGECGAAPATRKSFSRLPRPEAHSPRA